MAAANPETADPWRNLQQQQLQHVRTGAEPAAGSVDAAYSSVLESHQLARKDRMKKELESARNQLMRLHQEIQAKKQSHSVFVEENTSYPSEEHVLQLEAETSALRSDIAEAKTRLASYQSSALKGEQDEQGWVCKYCTVSNHNAMATCELCDMPRPLD
ncbi:TGF-beta-activated kinase 1 and MAP3K7-binding protein 2-like [Sycon ciliatum]|uniref:TGF-beta-activated kinase 1 and MAP3K7-binding protein 2-like n=1 Tax=Sycon ciliatum TaxID=27933 RepID=UPI0020A9E538|eukprot:scpid64248/ scgid23908/ TGF-beta-activated kinase 1 and MAP3K7-binding protein 2; Mitogen-activated protein kinase kinase kinase 7-interacting protein 2; TAK1-binding protein 2; TGF-beta-activated kinase 1-binding protein 2